MPLLDLTAAVHACIINISPGFLGRSKQRRIGRHGSCQYIAAIDSHALIGTMIDDESPLGLSWPLKVEMRGRHEPRHLKLQARMSPLTSVSQLAPANSPHPLEALLGYGSFPALQFPPKFLSRMEPILGPPSNC